MRVLVIREGNEPEVLDLNDTSLVAAAAVLGAATTHGHLLERRAVNGNRMMALYPGPGETTLEGAILEPLRPVLIASIGPFPDLDLTGDDVLAICQDVVLFEAGLG